MATKITDLTELAATPANDDVLHIIDVSDTTGGAAGTSKKIQITNLPSGGGSGTVTSVATGTGLTGGPVTTSGTISLDDTAVAAGTYVSPESVTVNAQGQLTSITGGGATIKSRSVTISNADVIAMAYTDTPKTLVTGVSGKIIIPLQVFFVGTYSTSTETSSANLYVGWDAATSGTSEYWGYSRDFMNSVVSGTRAPFFAGPSDAKASNMYDSDLANTDFQVWSSAAFNGGWTAKAYITYVLIDA